MSLSTLRMVVVSAFAATAMARGVPISQTNSTSHGQTIFYANFPSEDQVAAFSSGIFNSIVPVPTSYYECPPPLDDTFTSPSFSCRSSTSQTPESIYLASAGHPMPKCTHVGGAPIIFEQFQWATWTHSCWAIPVPAIPTPEGHMELSFQSRALYLRNVVLYQHDVHLLTLNRRIHDMVMAKEAQQQAMNEEREKHFRAIAAWLAVEMAKIPDYGRTNDERKLRVREHADERHRGVVQKADAAVAEVEARFWRDTWDTRVQVVELGHLVGEYFDWYMKGWAEGDWNGMGQVGFPGGKEYTVPPAA